LNLKNVRIKDGETLVIGGLIREIEMKNVQKIPVLGDLPVVGAAFRSSSTVKSKNELVIMITPKIINDGDSVADRL
jgi:type IV pilus assembly protein PilQ